MSGRGAAEDPLFVPGDGLLHDGLVVASAYRGRLLGVESEFFVVDSRTLELRDCMSVLERHSRYGSRVKGEIVCEQVEICSDPFSSIPELEAQLRADIEEALDLLDGVGATLLPFPLFEAGPTSWTPAPRLDLLRRHLGEPFREAAGTITADQVNVGARDEADAFAIFARFRAILPEILGLAAGSPLRQGEPNGTASNRMVVYDEIVSPMLQDSGIPPAMSSLADYASFLRRQPFFQSPGTCYSYLRPMPHRGVAVEIRCIDKQASLAETLSFVALSKAVTLSTGELPVAPDPSLPAVLASRRHGVVDPGRTRALLAHFRQFLPPEEARYLDPLVARAESGALRERLVREQARRGTSGLLRHLAEAFASEIRGEAEAPTEPGLPARWGARRSASREPAG